MDPAAGDVADHETHAPALGGDDLVPVAPHLQSRRRRFVADCELQPVDLRQGLRQQRALQRHGGLVLAAKQHRVVDRQPGTAGEILGQGQVAAVEVAPGLGRDQRHRAEAPAPRPERHDHGRDDAELSHQAQVLLVARRLHQHLVADLGVELGLAGADHLRRADLRVGIDRVASPQLLGQPDAARVGVRDRDVAQVAVLVDELDPAPVGDPPNGEVGELAQARVGVEGAGEQLARLREVGEALADQPLSLIEARTIERLRRLLGRGQEEALLLGVEFAGGREAEGQGPEGGALDGEGDHGQRGESEPTTRAAAGSAILELGRRRGPDGLARSDRPRHRQLGVEREVLPAGQTLLGVADASGQLDLGTRPAQQADRPSVRAKPGNRFGEQHVHSASRADLLR